MMDSVIIPNAHLCRDRISTSSAADRYRTYTTLDLCTHNNNLSVFGIRRTNRFF